MEIKILSIIAFLIIMIKPQSFQTSISLFLLMFKLTNNFSSGRRSSWWRCSAGGAGPGSRGRAPLHTRWVPHLLHPRHLWSLYRGESPHLLQPRHRAATAPAGAPPLPQGRAPELAHLPRHRGQGANSLQWNGMIMMISRESSTRYKIGQFKFLTELK